MLSRHKQAFIQSWILLKNTPIITSFTIFMLASVLVLPILLWMGAETLRVHLNMLQQEGSEITLYLNLDLTEPAILDILHQVRITPNVAAAKLITPSAGLEELQRQGLADWLHDLPSNPLPAVINITPKKFIYTAQDVQHLAMSFKKLDGVAQVQFDNAWVTNFYDTLYIVKILYFSAIILLIILVILVIMHILCYMVEQQRTTIRLLQLIGAPPAFIMRPYAYVGMLYGFFGAILALGSAIGIVRIVMYMLKTHLPLYNFANIYLSPNYVQALGVVVFIMLCSIVSARLYVLRLR